MRQGITQACASCHVPTPAAGTLEGRLRLAGHQVTPARRAVLGAVAAQTRPFTAGDLCAAVGAMAPSVGRATVFRTLDLLVDEGLLDRLYSLGPHVSYVPRDPSPPGAPGAPAGGATGAGGTAPGRTPAGQALYLVCATCHGAREIADAGLAAALRAAAARHAWPAEGALVEILGRCPACPHFDR
jgi:Fur family transcriptional regulator, ferric uptake regulator